MRNVIRIGAAAAVAGALIAAPGTADAVKASQASGAVGGVRVTLDGKQIVEPPIAGCDVNGQPQGSTEGVEAPDESASYGKGDTSCSRAQDGTASVRASGHRFSTRALTRYGGPEIRVRDFKANCSTTGFGANGSIEVSGVTGIDLPKDIPANHTVPVHSRENGALIANVVVNESRAPHPPDGSLRVSVMRITLFPQGGPASGDIVVGQARCAPFGR